MSRKNLRSDKSKEEYRFIRTGKLLFGEDNCVTGLIKIIGKFDELKESGRESLITNYKPDLDRTFKYENRGYTVIGSCLRAKYPDRRIARRHIKNLSRKWYNRRVLVNFDSDCIISEIAAYIKLNQYLDTAASAYTSQFKHNWGEIMPIQYEFLSVRHTDQHKHYRVATRIINELGCIMI